MLRARLFPCVVLCCLAAGGTARAEPSTGVTCYSTAETRSAIAEHKLAEPFALMRSAGRRAGGDAISMRLCRSGDAFIYEVSVLHRDGRLIKTTVDAAGEKADDR